MSEQKPPRRRIRTWAEDAGHLTHYDRSGRTLMLCVKCLLDSNPEATLNQAITVKDGDAICEWHLFPEEPQPDLDPVLEKLANGD